MKQLKSFLVMVSLIIVWGTRASAQSFDISDNGFTTTYSLVNDGKEVEVKSVQQYSDKEYIMPEEVTYMNRKYKVVGIGEMAFSYNQTLTSISIPNSITYIGKRAFEHCNKITSFTIPNSVKEIGYMAFYLCASLKEISIPNSVTTIEPWVFCECGSLTKVNLPNSITSIGESAFDGCWQLSSISIPNSVTDIGRLAFYQCQALKTITIPSNVKNIGEGAFSGCGLESVYSLNSEPPSIMYNYCFGEHTLAFATLYVPKGTKEKYKSAKGWGFTYIEETETSSINEVKFNNEKNRYIYNLNGEQLGHTQKGVNIINGKKYLLK